MFGRDRNQVYRSYEDAWRAAAIADSSHAIRRNVVIVLVLMAADLLLLHDTWLIWPLYALAVWTVWNTCGWAVFRHKVRQGLIWAPERPLPPFGGPAQDGGWRHG
ncbi:hypothetical protein ACFQ05_04390 [Amycolatopsis umgeniensis]|uniref:2TM domain-containing protein n=1 Tax=Amycolatopsis umgeniensis TaxID=336628 RepID=A0A841B1C1_9PSEU|nr:hypothetical protein [Amycolatopsis umgeniensis]MBB5852505.1 hypothetical protein [Amycolatopsis umgeniensis]